mgnify:CR=1 FL=1
MTTSTRQLPQHALRQLFDGTVPPGVYRWRPENPAAAVSDALHWAAESEWHAVALRLRGVDGKEAFLARCAVDLQLPSWFGHNWDALADCLRDLSWWGEPTGYLLLAHPWSVFEQADPEAAGTAVGVFAAAVDHWAARQVPMAVLLG